MDIIEDTEVNFALLILLMKYLFSQSIIETVPIICKLICMANLVNIWWVKTWLTIQKAPFKSDLLITYCTTYSYNLIFIKSTLDTNQISLLLLDFSLVRDKLFIQTKSWLRLRPS